MKKFLVYYCKHCDFILRDKDKAGNNFVVASMKHLDVFHPEILIKRDLVKFDLLNEFVVQEIIQLGDN